MLNTAAKIRVARFFASTLVGAGFRPTRRIRRHGILFDVDIREGIDLSLFLFGSFQHHIDKLVRRFVDVDGVVVDVGANVGAVTLPVAAYLRNGRVFAFEPTDFAFAKLQRNLELNPALSARVTAVRLFVADRVASTSEMVAYSSWPVGGEGTEHQHPVHKGVAKTASCGQTTLDAFVSSRQLSTLSLVKIDTDGHEFSVLSGARRCLTEQRPVVIFEACAYLMTPPAPTFEDFAGLFAEHDYFICHGERLDRISATEFAQRCPVGGGLDLVAVPKERYSGRTRN
jgi:FkbM family methyltransferase